jgi:hypothetical protein
MALAARRFLYAQFTVGMRILKRLLITAAILIVAVAALAVYLVRGGFRRFEITLYPVPPAAFTNWNDVLAHPRAISLATLQTGVVPRGWNDAGTARGRVSLERLRAFANAHPNAKVIYGHEMANF